MMEAKDILPLVIASIPQFIALAVFATSLRNTQKSHAHAIKNSDQSLKILTDLYNNLNTRVAVVEDWRKENQRRAEDRA